VECKIVLPATKERNTFSLVRRSWKFFSIRNVQVHTFQIKTHAVHEIRVLSRCFFVIHPDKKMLAYLFWWCELLSMTFTKIREEMWMTSSVDMHESGRKRGCVVTLILGSRNMEIRRQASSSHTQSPQFVKSSHGTCSTFSKFKWLKSKHFLLLGSRQPQPYYFYIK